MNDEMKQAMNVAIAEACGWKWDDNVITYPTAPDLDTGTEDQLHHIIPDFCKSLDAMATAESTLKPWEKNAVGCLLFNQLPPGSATNLIAFATAAQRAEAFCRLRKIGPFAESNLSEKGRGEG